MDYVAQAFATILARDTLNPPAPATALPVSTAGAEKSGGESPMVLIQPQQPHQVLP